MWVALAPTFVDRIALITRGNPKPRTEFLADDRTIFCALRLSKPTLRTKVRVDWNALQVEGAEPGTIRTTEYVTRPAERFVRSYVSLPEDWPCGMYSVATYVDGRLARTIDYTVVQRLV